MPSTKQRKNTTRTKRRARGRQAMAPTPFTMKVAPISNAVYRFVYTEAVSLSATGAGSAGSYTFSLNNLYDPNISGTGYQPIGFDQMSQIWLNYRVLKVRVKAEFQVVPGATNTNEVGMYPSGLSTMPADFNAWFVQPFCKTGVLSASGGPGSRQLYETYYPWSVLGVTKANYMNENDYLSSSTGGPLRPTYLHLFAKSIGVADTSAGCRVFLEYTVLATQPVALGMS